MSEDPFIVSCVLGVLSVVAEEEGWGDSWKGGPLVFAGGVLDELAAEGGKGEACSEAANEPSRRAMWN